MCSINHNLKALFIHIPKNGGSYVAEILSKYYGRFGLSSDRSLN